jgi:hypothetical protein
MIERFLFDRVDAEARSFAVTREVDAAVARAAHEAKAALAVLQLAEPRAEVALHPTTVFDRMEVRAPDHARFDLRSTHA